jgi:hypothetical protein
MGQFCFVVPQRDRLPPGAIEQAYLTGMEAVPFVSRNFWDGRRLIIERDVHESGNFHICWNAGERGPLLLSTASLMERDAPYLLPLELARGTLNRLRNQHAAWLALGLTTPEDFGSILKRALAHLVRSATQQSNPLVAAAEAEQSIAASLDGIDALADAYHVQVLSVRHEHAPQLATLLGAALPAEISTATANRFTAAFNSAVVPLRWHEHEPAEGQFDWTIADRQFLWLKSQSLKVCAGPLLKLDPFTLPDWLYLWEDDFEALQACIQKYITAAVERYRGAVHVWHCAAGLNLLGGLSLSEEQKLRLAVLAIDAVRRADPRTPVVISFDQPWGEYLQREELDLPPFHFADALVRAELGLAGVGLEINLGYWPGGTLPRDILEFNRLVDRWSGLGVPLVMLLSLPSEIHLDANAKGKTAVVGAASPLRKAELLRPLLGLLLAKSAIHGVFWNELSDAEPHVWPHSGLFDAVGQPKPAYDVMVELRRKHLT